MVLFPRGFQQLLVRGLAQHGRDTSPLLWCGGGGGGRRMEPPSEETWAQASASTSSGFFALYGAWPAARRGARALASAVAFKRRVPLGALRNTGCSIYTELDSVRPLPQIQ